MKSLNEAIAENNLEVRELYSTGKNHLGMPLRNFHVDGNTVVAFTLDHAKNILHQTKIDLGL